jgi:hypothetical protein
VALWQRMRSVSTPTQLASLASVYTRALRRLPSVWQVALSTTPNSTYVWNPAGTGDADRSLPFPLLLLSSNSTEAVRARAAANTATCAPAHPLPFLLSPYRLTSTVCSHVVAPRR